MSFAAQGFTSGWEFLSSKSLPAVVCAVLDVKMPDMSGLELQKRLAERRPGLPTIFVTAQADEASRASALEAGALAFLGKPVAEGELLGHVRRAATVWS
jgi:FixJ family two-component response regulator